MFRIMLDSCTAISLFNVMLNTLMPSITQDCDPSRVRERRCIHIRILNKFKHYTFVHTKSELPCQSNIAARRFPNMAMLIIRQTAAVKFLEAADLSNNLLHCVPLKCELPMTCCSQNDISPAASTSYPIASSRGSNRASRAVQAAALPSTKRTPTSPPCVSRSHRKQYRPHITAHIDCSD